MRDGRWGLGGMASGPGRGEVLVPGGIDIGLHVRIGIQLGYTQRRFKSVAGATFRVRI